MCSQNNEDDVILEYFGDKADGRFLDIGAHAGKVFSNTYALVERGWSGVLVEPSPGAFVELLRLHGGNERLTLVNAAVFYKPGWQRFSDADGDMVGSLNSQHVEKWSSRTNFKQYRLWAVSPQDLIDTFGDTYDFINVDVEGFSCALACQLLGMATADCWCIEHDNRTDEIIAVAEPLGLKQLAWNQENVVLGR